MPYDGALETCTECTRGHQLTRLSNPPERGIAHLRQIDPTVPIVYELTWRSVTAATLWLMRLHFGANPGPFPFSPPREGRTIKATWLDGSVPQGFASASHRTLRVQIRELIATD